MRARAQMEAVTWVSEGEVRYITRTLEHFLDKEIPLRNEVTQNLLK